MKLKSDYPGPLKNVLAASLLAVVLSARGQIMSDLVCAYSPSTASAWGGEANARVNLANAVMGSNALNDQSGTGANFNIAGYVMSSADPVGQDTGYILGLLASDPSFADVRNYGASVGADQIAYVSYNNTGAAGVAYQPGRYSAMASQWFWQVVLAHETAGHNYGRTHPDGKLNPKTIMLNNYCGGGPPWPYFYSNPNIWWNGAQMIGDGASTCPSAGTSQANGGDNSSFSAQWMANQADHVAIGPNLRNVILHWSFTNAPGPAPAGTTNYDQVSGIPCVVRGNGAIYTGSALRIPGGTTGNVPMSSMSAYLDLPNRIISSQTNITIEIWATPLSAPNWARIMDFGRCTQAGDGLGAPGEYTGAPTDPAPGTTTSYTGIMLSATEGTNYNQQRLEARLNGTNYTFDAALATTLGVQHFYAVTFTDGAGSYGTNGGRWEWYRDGYSAGFVDVPFHLSSISDVNNWLGRSAWSSDSNGNNDYAEVRISNVALSPGQILANYALGPNYNPPNNPVTMTGSDAWGATLTSFNSPGQWSNGTWPSAARNYQTYDYRMLTPATSASYTFAGNSLIIGSDPSADIEDGLYWGGTASSTITINNLIVNNARVDNRGSGTFTLAGNLTATNNVVVNAMNGPINLAANLRGNGSIAYVGNQGTQNGLNTVYSGNDIALTGNNTNFTGQTIIGFGAGAAGGLTIDSEARLGANPATFTYNQLDMNRGQLTTTATMTLSNANRGILLDVNGGGFKVAAGTTLTVACPLFSPTIAGGATGGNLNKSGPGTLILTSPNSGFNGMLYVDSGYNSVNDGVVQIANNTVMANAHSPIYIRDSGNSSSTLQLNGAKGGITLPQSISLNGRASPAPAIENLAGTNTIAGGISTYGGGNYLVQVDSGILNLGGTTTSSDGGSDTITFQGNGTVNLNGTISGAMSVNQAGSGTLNFSPGSSYSGSTTVSQGTLALQSSIAPVLHLTFDNAAGSGNGTIITNTGLGGAAMNGTLVSSGGASIVPGGRFGNALSLNGTGGSTAANIVLITNKCVQTDASGSWTVGYWLKTSTAGAVILYQGDGTWSSAGQTTFYLNNNGTTSGTHAGAVRWAGGWLTGTANLNDNNWHFVALVDNAGTETIYVDGNVDAVTATMANPLAAGANQVWIGGSPDPGDGTVKMTGLIDEVYMLNRALTQAEVQALYNNNSLPTNSGNVLPAATPVTVVSGATLNLGGVSQTIASLSGNGVVMNTGKAATLTLSNSIGTTTFGGSIADLSAGSALSLVQSGGATTILSGANTYRGPTTVEDGALMVNGSLGAGAVTVTNALLGGNGTLGGAVTVQSGGTLSPGAGIGILSVNNDVTLQSGSTTLMEINKSALTNDQLLVSGTLDYNGTLVVTNWGGALAGGDAFHLFQAGSLHGSFASYSLPQLNAGLAWNTNALSTGILSVVETTPTNLTWSVTGTNLNLSWPAGYTGWQLQVQTNALNVGLGTNWADVPGTDTTNSVNLPMDSINGSVFFRLIYR